MAEQDRKDLIPSVLNDLIDVDGEPSDGDSLQRVGGVWVPGLPGVNPNGPLAFSISDTHSGLTVGTYGASRNFFNPTDETENYWADYWGEGAGVDPVPLVPFAEADPGTGGIHILKPGIYDLSASAGIVLSATPPADSIHQLQMGIPGYAASYQATEQPLTTEHLMRGTVNGVRVTQADIDNDASYVTVFSTYLRGSGVTYETDVTLIATALQQWPGATHNTYPTP